MQGRELGVRSTSAEKGLHVRSILLMYGSETDPMFPDCAQALHGILPHSTVLRLPGLNHDSAQTYGKPETIAAALRLFFSQ